MAYLCRVLLSLLLLTFSTTQTDAQGVDRTLEDGASGPAVVQAVVDKIQQSCIFENDRQMLRRVALVETNDGTTPVPSGYYGGIWRVDENNFEETKTSSSLIQLRAEIETFFNIQWATVQWQSLVAPFYSGLAARMRLVLLGQEIPWSVSGQATLWWHSYTTNPDAVNTTTFTDAVEQNQEGCNSPTADLILVVDGSGSIGSSNFIKTKDFLKDLVGAFNIGADNVRVGLIVFSGSSNIVFDLDKYSTKDDVQDAISNADYPAGGTNTYLALRDLMGMLNTTARATSSGVPRIAIVFTDGKSNDESATVTAAAELHDYDVTVFAVGITSNVNEKELEVIGSSPTCIHVFNLVSFDIIFSFQAEIEKRSCRANAEVEPGDELSGILDYLQYQYFSIQLQCDGLTFRLSGESGSVSLYVSYTIPNPSSALYDYSLDVDGDQVGDASTAIYVPPRLANPNAPCNLTINTETIYWSVQGTKRDVKNAFKLLTLFGDQSGAPPIQLRTQIPLLAFCVALLF